MNVVLIWIIAAQILTKTTETLGEHTISGPLCTPQIPHGFLCNQTQAKAATGLPIPF